jgi:hypothetical protein
MKYLQGFSYCLFNRNVFDFNCIKIGVGHFL